MLTWAFLILFWSVVSDGSHFNGGTITWSPVDPHTNSSTVVITIVQSYSWVLSRISCSPDVPVSSGGSFKNLNLTCVGNCSNQGNYANSPIDILTDCISTSPALNILKSQRAKNVTLTVGAYFFISYRDEAWRALANSIDADGQDPYWSITTLINLQRRPDGILNSPPVSNIASPQYVLANRTYQIRIPVYDVNQGDDIRCRWSQNSRYLTHY